MAALDTRHLADLHALAAELGVERYRLLTRDELTVAILEKDPGAGEGGAEPAAPSGAREESAAAESAEAEREEPAERPARRRRRPRRSEGNGASGGDAEDDSGDDEPDDEGTPVTGVLDITPRGHGFIRLSGLEAADEDVYVSPSQIRRCEMQRGDEVAGPARRPRRGERYPALIHVDTINGVEPGGDRLRLTDATPVHPTRRIELKPADGSGENEAVALRAFDLLCAPAHGQRILIKAAAGSGRTTLLRSIAAPLAARDDLELVVLLVDERPEEVADWREAAPGAELAIATADMRPGEQLRLVELAVGHATRRAESGADVVLLVDSISRIAVAADDPGRVKPLFGAGRETAEDDLGALTVIATALTDGEDEGRVEEALETTESALLVLDHELAVAGVFPAIAVADCRISGEEHLRDEPELAAIRALRAELVKLPAAEAAAELRKRIEGSGDNAALLSSLAG
jgi:transcription termination factor Rho